MQKHFTDTIFYQIELTAKYCKLLGQQVFEKYSAGLSIEEFSILDTLSCNQALCQRDLAKLILKDRANTGKLLDNLEKKNYIKRELSVKNNRPVKVVTLTDEGLNKVQSVTEIVKPHHQLVMEKINNSDLSQLGNMLKELREVLNDTLDIPI